MRSVALLVLFFASLVLTDLACARSATGHEPADGTEADVKTPLGKTALHLVAACTGANHGRLVQGLGPSAYPNAEHFYNERLAPKLGNVHSVWGNGVGLRCDGPGIGTAIEIADWHDVDAVIAAVAQVLDDEKLSDAVSIEVNPVPVAD